MAVERIPIYDDDDDATCNNVFHIYDSILDQEFQYDLFVTKSRHQGCGYLDITFEEMLEWFDEGGKIFAFIGSYHHHQEEL